MGEYIFLLEVVEFLVLFIPKMTFVQFFYLCTHVVDAKSALQYSLCFSTFGDRLLFMSHSSWTKCARIDLWMRILVGKLNGRLKNPWSLSLMWKLFSLLATTHVRVIQWYLLVKVTVAHVVTTPRTPYPPVPSRPVPPRFALSCLVLSLTQANHVGQA